MRISLRDSSLSLTNLSSSAFHAQSTSLGIENETSSVGVTSDTKIDDKYSLGDDNSSHKSEYKRPEEETESYFKGVEETDVFYAARSENEEKVKLDRSFVEISQSISTLVSSAIESNVFLSPPWVLLFDGDCLCLAIVAT